jgi:hypothetical protein
MTSIESGGAVIIPPTMGAMMTALLLPTLVVPAANRSTGFSRYACVVARGA